MDIGEELAAAGAARQNARQEARTRVLAASAEIARLAQDALDAGMTKTEVARLAQVSRPALDTMLAKNRRRSRKRR